MTFSSVYSESGYDDEEDIKISMLKYNVLCHYAQGENKIAIPAGLLLQQLHLKKVISVKLSGSKVMV